MNDLSVKKMVAATKRSANSVVKNQAKLFVKVKECVDLLRDDETKLKEYKRGVLSHDACRSAVFVMFKVALSTDLRKFEDNLPKSYQTLYECLKLLNEVELDKFSELVDVCTLHEKLSKSDVKKLREQFKSKVSSGESRKDRKVSNTLEQFLEDSNSLSERERLTVAEKLGDSLETSALEDLVSYFTDVLEHRNCVNEV
jgi:hypothetical protein